MCSSDIYFMSTCSTKKTNTDLFWQEIHPKVCIFWNLIFKDLEKRNFIRQRGVFLPKMQVFLQQTLAYICTSPSNLYICQGFKMIFNARVKLLINKITRIAKGIALIYINFWWISSSVLFIIYLFIFDYISHFGSNLLWLTFYLIVGSN